MNIFRVAPSDFAFLYDSCKRCWWMKVHGLKPPGEAIPAVFGHVDRAMRRFLSIEALQSLGIPAESMVEEEEWVRSVPFEAFGAAVQVSGKRDRTVTMQDGGFGVIDYKLTVPTPETAHKYSRQLHGYEYALRNPLKGCAKEVSYLGLVCFDGFNARFKSDGADCAMIGRLVSQPVDIDRAAFEAFLTELCRVAASPVPEPSHGCQWCEVVNEHAHKILSLSTEPSSGAVSGLIKQHPSAPEGHGAAPLEGSFDEAAERR